MSEFRGQYDPTKLRQLEDTRQLLSFWQGQRKELNFRLGMILEGEAGEDGQRKYHSNEVAKVFLAATDLDVDLGVPQNWRRFADYLQLKVTVCPKNAPDTIKIDALVPVRDVVIQPIERACS